MARIIRLIKKQCVCIRIKHKNLYWLMNVKNLLPQIEKSTNNNHFDLLAWICSPFLAEFKRGLNITFTAIKHHKFCSLAICSNNLSSLTMLCLGAHHITDLWTDSREHVVLYALHAVQWFDNYSFPLQLSTENLTTCIDRVVVNI